MRTVRFTAVVAAILIATPIALSATPFAAAKVDEPIDLGKDEHLDEGVGVSNASCPLGAGVNPLSNGVTVTSSLPAVSGASCEFSFVVPGGHASTRVELFGLAADFDLYVKRGSVPTTSSFDCRPFSSGTVAETCVVANNGQDVYAMVRRFSGSGAFSIRATAFSPCSFVGTQPLAEGVTATASLTSDTGASCLFSFTTGDPTLVGDLAKFDLDSGASNFDLYVRAGTPPTTSSYTCRSILTSSADSCSIENAAAGTVVYALVSRFTGSGSFSITAAHASSCSLGPGVHAIGAGGVSAALTGTTGAKCYFSLTPSSAADFVQWVLPATSPNDYDLYVKLGAIPTTTSYDCRPYSGGSVTETCDHLADGQTQYAMVRRFSGLGGPSSLSATEIVVPTLENGVPVTGTIGQGATQYYKVVMPGADANGYAPSQLAVALGADAVGAACAAVDANAGAGTCASVRNADATACATANGANPGTCAGVYTAASDACAAVNTVNPGTCTGAPDVQVASPNADLWIRHKVGLPTASVADCRSSAAGSVDSCVFSSEGVQARTDAAAAYTQARADAWAQCPDPSTCGPNPLPGFPTLPAQANLVPFKGAGKYFIAVRGATGPADYAILAGWA